MQVDHIGRVHNTHHLTMTYTHGYVCPTTQIVDHWELPRLRPPGSSTRG